MNPYLRLTRPRQWFKSLFVLIGATLAIFLAPFDPMLIVVVLALGILDMIMIQSIVYIVNDIADAPLDRKHPEKKNRKTPQKLCSSFP